MSNFYQSFLDLYKHQNDVANKKFANADFRKYISEHERENKELFKEVSQSLIKYMLKPQQLIHDEQDYYIAQDMTTNTFYICYKNLMMIDIDFYKEEIEENDKISIILNRVEEYVKKSKVKLNFMIYTTRNGVHLFLVNRKCDYKNLDDIKIMLDLNCDYYYSVYSYIRGWSVRLNRKKKDNEILYKYIRDVGNTNKKDKHLVKLVNLHINLLEVFKNENESLMFGN